MGSKSSSGPKQTEAQKEIEALTLARLTREEEQLKKDESMRASLLASGRTGRKSLLTSGYRGPGTIVRTARAVTRANERATQATTLLTKKSADAEAAAQPVTYWWGSKSHPAS